MSATKFTPGPWHRSDILDNDRWGIITTDNLIVVGSSQHLTAANAALIAAAPELYAERKEIRDTLRTMQIALETRTNIDLRKQLDDLIAHYAHSPALKKARGE